ncbi:MAG: hypothetical protein Q9175_004229 [Cornicularia normoerica]
MPNHPPTDGSWRHQLGGPSFPVEPDRYHLYVGLFCPFAHRAIIAREFKGLQKFLPMSTVKPYPKDNGGWRFPATDDEYLGSTVDHLFHSKFLHEVYFKSDSKYRGKYSVPVLWDKKTNQIPASQTQESYEENCRIVFETLDQLEKTAASTSYILGTTQPTEIDLKLYTTLVRFDTIYQQHFKLMVSAMGTRA